MNSLTDKGAIYNGFMQGYTILRGVPGGTNSCTASTLNPKFIYSNGEAQMNPRQ